MCSTETIRKDSLLAVLSVAGWLLTVLLKPSSGARLTPLLET